MEARPTLLYIGGYPRSGSTILSRLLGQLDGFTDIGELANAWRVIDRGWGTCGCAVDVIRCPFWADVFTQLDGWQSGGRGFEPEAAEGLVAAHREAGKSSRVLRSYLTGRLDHHQLRYGRFLARLYGSIAGITGATTVVDSSKDPWWATYAAAGGVKVAFLHLLRDPRGVYYSRARSRQASNLVPDGPLKTLSVAAGWAGINVTAAASPRLGIETYIRASYESIMSEPEIALPRLLMQLGLGDHKVPIVNSMVAIIRPGHSISGNPSRFQQGAVPLVADEAWRSELSRGHKASVMATAGLVWWYLRRHDSISRLQEATDRPD